MPSVITLDEDELKRINALYAVYDAAKSSNDFVYSDKYLTIYSGFEPTKESFRHYSTVYPFVDQCYDAALMKANGDVSKKAGTLKVALRNDNVSSLLAKTEKEYGHNNFFNGGSSKKRASTHRRLKSRTASAARRRNNRRRRTARK